MATSSFSKEFIINDSNAVDQLIDSLNNPITIKLAEQDTEKETQEKESILCKLEQRLVLQN